MTVNQTNHEAMTRATLSDVAARAGVSKSTVSMVLNDHPQARHYSLTTRQRVAAAARELGYRPNLFARQLRQARTKWLMLCFTNFREYFATEVAHAFEARAAARGYTLVVLALNRREGVENVQGEILSRHGVGAVAVVGEATIKQLPNDAIAQLADEGTHCVLINRELDHPRVGQVLVDHRLGQREVAAHLYDQGVTDLLMLAGPEIWTLGIQRREAVQQCARDFGRPEPTIIHTPTARWNAGYAAVQQRLQKAPPPHAIVAATDYLAYGAMKACDEAGLKIGRDVAVAGFDDIFPSQFTGPPLMTVRLPMDEMGTLGADMLIDALEGKASPGTKLQLPTHMVIRESGRFAPEPADRHGA